MKHKTYSANTPACGTMGSKLQPLLGSLSSSTCSWHVGKCFDLAVTMLVSSALGGFCWKHAGNRTFKQVWVVHKELLQAFCENQGGRVCGPFSSSLAIIAIACLQECLAICGDSAVTGWQAPKTPCAAYCNHGVTLAHNRLQGPQVGGSHISV